MRGKKLSPDKIKELKNLRYKGYSLNEISKKLEVPKTTTFSYIKECVIDSNFYLSLKSKRGGSRERRHLKEKNAYNQARLNFLNPSFREKVLFLAALYWAEGSKKDFGLSNTDPNLIKVFIEGLREVFEIPDDRFRVSIRIYEDLDKDLCLNFWEKVVNIPKDKFVNVNILRGKKVGKLQYGMCRIRVSKGGDLLKKIIAINKVINESFVPIA